jgi:hypothetical protein
MLTIQNFDIERFKILKPAEYIEFIKEYLISCGLTNNNYSIENILGYNVPDVLLILGSDDVAEYVLLLDFFDLLAEEFKKIPAYLCDFNMIC